MPKAVKLPASRVEYSAVAVRVPLMAIDSVRTPGVAGTPSSTQRLNGFTPLAAGAVSTVAWPCLKRNAPGVARVVAPLRSDAELAMLIPAVGLVERTLRVRTGT